MELRRRYEEAVRSLHGLVAAMRGRGASSEAVARAAHAERLKLSVLFKSLTPEPYRSRILERTLRVYGCEAGPSIDFLRASGKSWEEITEGATRPGPPVGIDPSDEPD